MKRVLSLAALLFLLAAPHADAVGVGVTRLIPPDGGLTSNQYAQPSISPYGSVAYVKDNQVWIFDGQKEVLASKNAAGVPGNGVSSQPAIWYGGTFVAFTSDATNLVPDDTNGVSDIFVKFFREDPSTGYLIDGNDGIVRITPFNDNGTPEDRSDDIPVQPNGRSFDPALDWSSGIAWASEATNLVPNDNNLKADVFTLNLDNPFTEDDETWGLFNPVLVSQTNAGQLGNGNSREPTLDRYGQRIAFQSDSSNFVPDDFNGATDVFMFQWSEGLSLISTGVDGTPASGTSRAPAISPTGQQVVFESNATDLAVTDGVAIPNLDTNGTFDIFMRDLGRTTTELISVATDGSTGNGESRNPHVGFGPFTFESALPYEVNSNTPVVELLDGNVPQLVVAFESEASNLVGVGANSDADTNGVGDVFLRSVQGQWTRRVSLNSVGGQGDKPADQVAIAPDGTYVAFVTESVLDAGDQNTTPNVYVNDRFTCFAGANEDGPVTEPLHYFAEPLSGPVSPVVHEASCTLATRGL